MAAPELPGVTPFLNSVCPGFPYLDHNIHYSLKDEPIGMDSSVSWPIAGTNTTAKLSDTYLNIARPPLSSSTNESTTYVSLPYHVTNLFKKVVATKDKKQEGNMHIGANVNPLNQDPFKMINLNPGCISHIIETKNASEHIPYSAEQPQNQNPLSKLANNLNKLLKFTTYSSTKRAFEKYDNLLQHNEPKKDTGNTGPNTSSSVFDKILHYNASTYHSELSAPSTSKLLVSTHVNVLNVIAIGSDSNYKNTKQITTKDPAFPYQGEFGEQLPRGPVNPNDSSNEDIKEKDFLNHKTIEEPLLRLQFRHSSVVTALHTFMFLNREPVVVVGLDSGEVVVINLTHLKYQVFDDLGLERYGRHQSDSASIKSAHSTSNQNYSHLFGNIPVTAIDVISHPRYDFLIVAGYSNGEILIIDPTNAREEKPKRPGTNRYVKKVVAVDPYVTYFKKFDLSIYSALNEEKSDEHSSYPEHLVGHFKFSNKPITAITSTIPYEPKPSENTASGKPRNPMLLTIGCDDGFVRFIDLMFSRKLLKECTTKKIKDKEYPTYEKSIITDVISNYFNDGITDIKFSPDCKFLCVVGKGDLIEIFKMTYYNVNGLLNKNSSGSKHHNHTNSGSLSGGRRSRSGTIGSLNSGTQPTTTTSLFSHQIGSTHHNSLDIQRPATHHIPSTAQFNPPMIKDVKILARFKGHTNTVSKLKFVKDSLLEGNIDESSAGLDESVYKLISCGYDGKVIIWEFDYKALSKLKSPPKVRDDKKKNEVENDKPEGKPDIKEREGILNRRTRSDGLQGPNGSRSPVPIVTHGTSQSPIKSRKSTYQFGNLHTRTRSINGEEFTTPLLTVNSPTFNNLNNSLNNIASGATMNMNTILNAVSTNDSEGGSPASDSVNNERHWLEHVELVTSFYRSLLDLRFKRHYKALTKHTKNAAADYGTIFHPIVDDKEVPSIEQPLLVLDISSLVHDGKVDGFHLDALNFWCYAKNGDVFRYIIQ